MIMRFRSTGLGKTELQAYATGLEPVDDLLILHVQTTEPVRWHIRAGLQRGDVFKLIRFVFNFQLLKYLFGFAKAGNSKEPEDF